jgi:hypothetical protein
MGAFDPLAGAPLFTGGVSPSLEEDPCPLLGNGPYPHRSCSSLGSVGSVTGEKAICDPRVDGRQSGSQVESSNFLKNSAKRRFRGKAHGSIRIQEGEPNKNKDLGRLLPLENLLKSVWGQHLGQQFTDFALGPPCPIRAGRQCGHFEGFC